MNRMRDVLFILGMHRSGTSVTTRICSLLGAQLPKTLLKPNVGNPKGYWESDVIVRHNEQALNKEGFSWFDLPSWSVLRSVGQKYISSSSDFLEILESEYISQECDGMPILIKDPRISLFLPEYENLIDQSKTYGKIRTIICLRSPLEVAGSIYERDQLDKISSQMVWLTYMLHAEKSTRHLDRSFVKYTDLFTDNAYDLFLRNTNSLNLNWLNDSVSTRQSIDDFITPNLYRQKSKTVDMVMPYLVEKAYMAFLKLANNQDVHKTIEVLDECFDILESTVSALSKVRENLTETLTRYEKMLAASERAHGKVISSLEKEKSFYETELSDLKQKHRELEKLMNIRVDEEM